VRSTGQYNGINEHTCEPRARVDASDVCDARRRAGGLTRACIREGMLNRCAAAPARAYDLPAPSHVRACAHTWLCCRPAERFTTTIRHQRAEHSHPHPWILVFSFVAILLPSGRGRALARETNRECVEERCASAAAIPKIAATDLSERLEVLLTPDRALLDFALFCLIIRFRTRVSTGD